MAIAFQVLILHDSGNTGPGDVIAAGYTDLTLDSRFNASIMSVRTDAVPPVKVYADSNADVTEWNGTIFSDATKNYDVATQFVVWDPVNEEYIILRRNEGSKEVLFDANNVTYPSSNSATASSINGHPIINYKDTGAERAFINSTVPGGYKGEDFDIFIDAISTTATTGGVTWGIEFERDAPGGSSIMTDSFAAQQTATSTTNGTVGVITRTIIPFTQIQADGIKAFDSYRVIVQRVTGDVGDDMLGDAAIVKVGAV